MSAWKNVRMITYGFLIGTAGVAILSSKDMKAAYTHITVKTFTTLKENCEDINADANDINAKRAAAERAQEIADARALVAEADAEEKEKADRA